MIEIGQLAAELLNDDNFNTANNPFPSESFCIHVLKKIINLSHMKRNEKPWRNYLKTRNDSFEGLEDGGGGRGGVEFTEIAVSITGIFFLA